jgi:hypothetical protein
VRVNKEPETSHELIPHTAEHLQSLAFGSGGRVWKVPVDHLCSGPHRARFLSLIAGSDQVVELLPGELVHVLEPASLRLLLQGVEAVYRVDRLEAYVVGFT